MVPGDLRLRACLLALSLIAVGVTTRAEDQRGPRVQPVTTTSEVAATSVAAERDRLWKEALEAAQKLDWEAATKSGVAALKLQEQHFGDQTANTCAMLESLSYWYIQRKQFAAAFVAAKRLLARRTKLLGDQHWLTLDARLNLENVLQIQNLSDEAWKAFSAADKLHIEASRLVADRKFVEGYAKAEQAHATFSRILGKENSLALGCLATMAACKIEQGQYFKARPLVQELEPRLKVYGWVHPQAVHTHKILARYNEMVGDWSQAEIAYGDVVKTLTILAGKDHPETISARVELARMHVEQKKHSTAEPELVKALAQLKSQLGEEHLYTGQTLKVLGDLYRRMGKLREAEPYLNQAVGVLTRTAGDKHMATAGALNARGQLRMETWRFDLAMIDFNESLDICNKTLGEEHSLTARVLDNQALLYEYGSNTGMARRNRQKSLKICEQAYGEVSPQTASALENLARTSLAMQDYGLAESYLLRAREIRRAFLGDSDPQTAMVVGQLGHAYLGAGDIRRARPLLEESLKVMERAKLHDPVEAARIRLKLALLYQGENELAAAETEYRRALTVLENRGRQEPFVVAAAKVGLGQTLLSFGKASAAREELNDVFRTYDAYLRPEDPHFIDALAVSGTIFLAMGDLKNSEREFRRGLGIAQDRMLASGAFQSERQRLSQFVMMRSLLDFYLSLAEKRDGASGFDVALAYGHVLSWKGGIATRQWRDQHYATPKAASLNSKLQQISRRLSTLALQVPPAEEYDAWIRRMFELNLRKESLEEERAAASTLRGDVRDEVVTVAAVRKALPANVVLIDLLQYTHWSYETQGRSKGLQAQQRYAAFIVRRDRDVERVDLGDATPIGEAVVKWRKTRGFRPNAGKADWAATVGQLVWPRLKPHVAGCKTILISPDGHLSHFAWCVLPGERPNSYLIEDYAIGTIPVPQMLPLSLATPLQPAKSGSPGDASLLLIGDIDFNATLKPAQLPTGSKPSQERLSFEPLPGTAEEIRTLDEEFRQCFPQGRAVVLAKSAATESAFWNAAPRHRWLHIATHGFFAPQAIREAIAAQKLKDPAYVKPKDGKPSTNSERVSIHHVGFLNGLALSGANTGAVNDEEDGILTAAELSTMNLRGVELAVLSGCETGLGEIQGGEGAFGLQRALQIAGVRATMGSLWSVSDEKTNLLMQRFYANLWNRKLSKLEALREAQLWILRTGGSNSDPPTVLSKPLSPHYWAPFSLSGDWR